MVSTKARRIPASDTVSSGASTHWACTMLQKTTHSTFRPPPTCASTRRQHWIHGTPASSLPTKGSQSPAVIGQCCCRTTNSQAPIAYHAMIVHCYQCRWHPAQMCSRHKHGIILPQRGRIGNNYRSAHNSNHQRRTWMYPKTRQDERGARQMIHEEGH